MNPRALVLTRTGNAIPMGGKCDEPGAPSMPEILGGILGTMTEERRSVLESIALALDGYYVDMDANPDVKHLEKDFQTNPASAVKQSIMTVVATDDRCGGFDMDAVTQTYTIADGGVIEWGEELATLDIGFIGPFLVRIFGKEGL